MLNLDTHILIDLMIGHVSKTELAKLQAHEWCISDIVLWELFKLNQIGRIEMDFTDSDIRLFLNSLKIYPIDLSVLTAMGELDFKSDPADEIIAATSLANNIPLLTRDRKILKSKKVPLA